MAVVEKITQNQVKLMRLLLNLNRETPRKEIIQHLKFNPTSLQFAIKPIDGYFLNVKKEGNKDFLSLTDAGEMAINAFNLANVTNS